MKKLTIAEKAQRYDEAIKKIKYVMEHDVQPVLNKEDLQEIFPELTESDDEKIRKGIIRCVKGNMPDNDFRKKYIAWLEKQKSVEEIVERCKKSWYNEGKIDGKFEGIADDVKYQQGWHDALEKQGEQKLTLPKWKYKKDDAPLLRDSLILNRYGRVVKAVSGAMVSDAWVLDYDELAKLPKEEKANNSNKVKSKFNEGEWITNGQLTCKVLTVTGKSYDLHLYNDDYCHFETDIQSIDKDYHLWTIADAKDGDVLVASDGSIFIFAGVDVCACKYYVALTTDNYVKINKEAEGGYWETSRAVHPATKEQRDILKKAMNDAGWQFDFERKELKKIESNPAWSEEDEQRIKKVMHIISCDGRISNEECKSIFDWLKSLKDRVGCEANCTTTKELSESDEEEFQIAIDTLVEAGQRDSAHWLESIKDRVQPHWKPSEKQLDALQYVYRNCNPPLSDKLGWDSIRTLELMYQDLKKLKEE